MASPAPASSSSAKRALRKRKVQASLESGSASFGSANRRPQEVKHPKNLGRPLTEAERAVHMLATPWPKSMGASGSLFNSYINEAPEEFPAKIDIKHSPSSPTG
jgi:hypothetical protein